MNGFPKWINSIEDIRYCLTKYPDQTKTKLQEWIDNRFIWVTTGEVMSLDAGTTDDTHRVIEDYAGPGEHAQYLQQELQEDPNCKLFRLGLTVEEAICMVIR